MAKASVAQCLRMDGDIAEMVEAEVKRRKEAGDRGFTKVRYFEELVLAHLGAVTGQYTPEEVAKIRAALDEVKLGRPSDPNKPAKEARIPVAQQKKLDAEKKLAEEREYYNSLPDAKIKQLIQSAPLGQPISLALFERMKEMDEQEAEDRALRGEE